MISIKCATILVLVSVAFAAPNGSQSTGQLIEAVPAVATKNNASLRDQWTFGNCGTYVRSQDLVYYDHVRIQANSASTTLTSTVNWVGTRRVYCVELTGNQGTQLVIRSGGVGYTSVQISGVSGVGKDLEGIVYVYAN